MKKLKIFYPKQWIIMNKINTVHIMGFFIPYKLLEFHHVQQG